MRVLAVFALFVWAGAVHHDVWLGVLEIAHHHDDHAAADHRHHEEGDAEHSPGENHSDSVPLPDIHSTPVSGSASQDSPTASKRATDQSLTLFAVLSLLFDAARPGQSAPPPPVADTSSENCALTLLAFSVQSNAPPSLV